MRVSTIVANRMSPVSQMDFSARPEVKFEVTEQTARPGPKAAVSDAHLSTQQLEKRNKMRQRNKEAAQRVRDRRVQKVKTLEDLVAALESKNKMLELNNQYLQATVVAQNKQLQMQSQLVSGRHTNFHRQVSNTEMPTECDFGIPEKIPETNIQIYSNGKGQGGILMTEQTAFILSPLHQLQLTLNSSPQKPQNLNELENFLDAM